MDGKFDGMYMNHPENNHDEWAEESREIYKQKRVGRREQGVVETQIEIVKT